MLDLLQVQLCIIVVHTLQALRPSCQAAPKILVYSYIPNILLVIYLFYNFYRVNYKSAAKKVASAAEATPSTCLSTAAPADTRTKLE